QGDDIGPAVDAFEHPDDISQDKEDFAATNIESSEGLRRETRAGSQVSHGVNGDTHHLLEADA
ncbi:hypothetical protein Tco_0124255, partial [Tanacetum coccineum]